VIILAGNWSQAQHMTGVDEQVRTVEKLASLVQGWARQPRQAFFDLNINISPASPVSHRWLQVLFTGLCLVLVAYALFHLWRTTDKRAWLFVFALIGVPGAGLVLQDLVLRGPGGVSVTPRYLVPCFLGFQLAVAHLFGSGLAPGDARRWPGLLGRGVLIVLLAGGIFSCVTYAGSRVWWTKGGVHDLGTHLSASRLINASSRPLVISDCSTWSLMFTSHLLDPHVHLLVKPDCYSCKVEVARDLNPELAKVSECFTDVFLYPKPSEQLLARIEPQRRYNLKRIPLGEIDYLLLIVEAPP
jgi:uncharacterized membrane protein